LYYVVWGLDDIVSECHLKYLLCIDSIKYDLFNPKLKVCL